MKRKHLFILFTVLSVSLSCSTANVSRGVTKDYANTIRSTIAMYGWDLKDYFFRATPVGNFGIGTMYLNESNSTDARVIESHWLLSHPAVWFEESLSAAARTAILNRIIMSGGYGSISAESSIKRNTDAKLALPILNVLVGDLGLDVQKGVKSQISADQAVLRRMVWPEFTEAVIGNKMSSSVTRVYQRSNYSIVASDIVLKNYKVIIEVDKTSNPQLNLKLDAAIGTVIGQDASGSLTFKKVSEGKFEAVASEDVVAAVLFKKPPPEQDRASDAGAWKNTSIAPAEITKLETAISKRN